MAIDENYNDVAARMREFFTKYPDGSLQQARPLQVFEFPEATFIAYTARARRTPEDAEPGEGTAWERVPGLTNFTRNSELQNAETSAWGRAILAVGAADTKKGIASREEVQSRAAEDDYYKSSEYVEQQALPGERKELQASIDKHIKDDPEAAAALKAWFADENLPAVKRMDRTQCDKVIGHLMGLPFPVAEEVPA